MPAERGSSPKIEFPQGRRRSSVTRPSVALDGTVTGTIDHVYGSFGLERSYTITGTLTPTTLTLSGTGLFLPNPMSAVPWDVVFSVGASR
ncbi:MAG TPA: hypothetical protein VF469_24825 [Kofleriaceae bacterium]